MASKLKTVTSVRVNPNVRCWRVRPVEDTKKNLKDLQTIAIELDREQAIHLATVLLTAAQKWEGVGITAYRFRRRSDGTYPVTVTARED
jgi:hypothetical protein